MPVQLQNIFTCYNDRWGNRYMQAESIFDLPFDDVVKLYNQKLHVESTNNVRARTKLLKVHPELFNKETFLEIEAVVKLAYKVTKTQLEKSKVLHFDFKTYRKKLLDNI
jgi:hypothetical protein